MITKEMLFTASNYSKRCENYRGVLTTREAEGYLKEHKSVVVLSNMTDGTFFFTDDHCFGVRVLPEDWVPCTTQIPQRVEPRDGLEDGIIKTIQQYISVYEHGHQVTSIDELIIILNRPQLEVDKDVIIGEGVLSWNRDERISNRYGSVNLNISTTENGKVVYDKTYEGKYGFLAAFIKESRPSPHVGYSLRKLHPIPSNVGDVIILGIGTLFFEIKDGVEDVGLIPIGGRTTDWLSPGELYKVCDQTVVLIFKELHNPS